MKKTILMSLATLLITFQMAVAQKKENRNVGSFDKLSFGVPGKLYLKQGNTTQVVLEGDPDVLDKVETEVSGGRLVIRAKDKWFKWNWGNQKITAYVTMKDIRELGVGGSGSLIAEGRITSNSISLKVGGSGDLTIEMEANGEMEADVSGSGNMDVKGRSKGLKSNVSGSGKVRLSVNVNGDASFGISGSGKIEASGSANKVRTSISGSGKLMGADFNTNTCDVRISGSGNVEIGVKEELDANISGSGSVAYRGNPNKINSHSSGSGKVRKM